MRLGFGLTDDGQQFGIAAGFAPSTDERASGASVLPGSDQQGFSTVEYGFAEVGSCLRRSGARSVSFGIICICLCICLWCVTLRSAAFRCVLLPFLPRRLAFPTCGIFALGLSAIPSRQAAIEDDAPLHGVDDGCDGVVIEVEGSSGIFMSPACDTATIGGAGGFDHEHGKDRDDAGERLAALACDHSPLRISGHVVPEANPVGHVRMSQSHCAAHSASPPARRPPRHAWKLRLLRGAVLHR